MNAPSPRVSAAEPARLPSRDAQTRADVVSGRAEDMHQVRQDAYSEAGRSAAARAIVAPLRQLRVKQSMGLSPLLDAATAFAQAGYDTRCISEASATEMALALDANRSGFEVRLAHMLVERTVDQALIGSRARQRLSSSLNQAFGRTGERLDNDRPTTVDNLGLRRGEQGFTDTLIEVLAERRTNVQALVAAIKETKTADALSASFEAVSKVFPSSAFAQADRVKILSAFLQAQGRLRANVVKITPGAGLLSLQIASHDRAVSVFEKQALAAHLKSADSERLEQMRAQINTVVNPPLFQPGEAKAILAEAEQRLMYLRAMEL